MSVLLAIICSSCSDTILNEICQPDYILYRYRNNIGEETTKEVIRTVTDFIFTPDSVLFRVDENITNGNTLKRPVTLPDGEWIIVSYANLTSNSDYPYVVGKTRLSEMSLRVSSKPTYAGEGVREPEISFVGDSDRLYYGRVRVNVSKGKTKGLHVVDMSNVHIWLNVTVKWSNPETRTYSTKQPDNLHVRLETVPVEQWAVTDDKLDSVYNIAYQTPRITRETVSHIAKLHENNDGDLVFNSYGLRWETGQAPTLRFYDGEKLLINKELDLNKYLATNHIDLTNTRVQFYNLIITVSGDNVSVSTWGVADWETGYLN